MSNPDLSNLRAATHHALLTAIREELGGDLKDRTRLLECYTSLKRTLADSPSPNTDIISDMGYRAMLAAELETVFMKLYDAGRDGQQV